MSTDKASRMASPKGKGRHTASPGRRYSIKSDRRASAASLAASAGGQDSKRPKFTIWPEWNDVDVNAEKWTADAAKKEDKKGKSPTVQSTHFYEDPDGKIEMPPSMKVETWKRPTDFIMDKVPVIVDTDNVVHGFDLIAANEHLHESEYLRYCISQIMALWNMCSVPVPPETLFDAIAPGDDPSHTWRPWEHIYALCKAGKGPHLPLYNNHGKYVVRLYWMGCWRKITIDDTIPFDDQGRMLLPATTLQHELWPMLLTKALIKVASLDYAGGNPSQEFGDVSVLQCLTGWIPEAIPLQPSHMEEVWELMKSVLPEWKLPEQEWEKTQEMSDLVSKESTPSETPKDDKVEKESTQKDMKDGKEKGKDGKEKGKDGKDKEKGKDDKKDKKDKDKDKDKDKKEKSSLDDFVIPEKPEIVMFATYSSTPKYPVKVSVLGEMADASEKLRQNGLSHMYPHPVCITQTRSCPLEPPPPPVVIPAWKLIRPRKKKSPPHDEPVPEPEPQKEIQCLEITSPFVNYKVSPVPIPTDTHRPKSSLERGGARSKAENDMAIEETDENAPTPPAVTPEPEPVPPPVEEVKEGKPTKPGSASKERLPLKRPESRQSAKGDDAKGDKSKDAPAPGGPPLGGHTAGGLFPPSQSVFGTDGEMVAEEEQEPEPPQDNTPKPKKAWMDFDVFCKCFRTLYVFHKSNTYLCNQRYSDLKNVTPSSTAAPSKAEKKPPQATLTPSDGSPFYLFVDNLAPTEIVVSYSVLARWFEPSLPLIEEKKSNSVLKSKDKDLDKEATNASISLESVAGEQKPPPPVTPGTLVAEPYSWKSLITGQPILRLRTTGTKSAVLRLPPGRHVLRFMMSSPLGHHVHMCSTVNFVFGDEETVMPQLTNESCRFRDNASQVIMNLGKCILNFRDEEIFKAVWEELVRSHCPYLDDKQMSKQHHFNIFNESLYTMLKKTVKEIITPDIAFAWRALMNDATTPNILAIPVGSRPATQGSGVAATGSASVRGSAKPGSKKRGAQPPAPPPDSSQVDVGEAEKPENPWANREPTIEEHIASVKLQSAWRGYYIRKIKQARIPGTEENLKVADNLNKCWPLIEANTEDNGLLLLREMFRRDPDIMPHYPFYKDEWNKISYADYKGVFPDQPSMNWFLVFRDIFYVKEEMLVVPRLYVPINTCMLRIIDNDTGQEIPRVFQKVAPYVYKKNKKGYSFVADARTVEQPLSSGNWRMRLIGSLNALPAPQTGEVCCNFVTKEIRDYYIPNPKNIVFRYAVKVTEDHFASLQMNTSKQDVYIKLSVLDNEEEVVSAVGKGHVVIPAFTFLKDITQEDIDNRRSSSRSSMRGEKPAPPAKGEKSTSKIKRTESAVSSEHHPPSRGSMRSDAELAERLEDSRPHKYILQATVLQNSWPLSESSWRFVQMLKEMEKNELKVSNKERPPSPPKVEKAPAAGAGKNKPKGGKDKGKDKGQDGKGSRPSSQQFDITKPNWTLRVVSDAVAAEEIEVKKDTERADEIRAMKKAWEDAEPGRAAKALQSRLKYLNSHTIKLVASEESQKEELSGLDSAVSGEPTVVTEPEVTAQPQTPISVIDQFDTEQTLTLEPPPPPAPKEILEPLDLTPFIRKTLPEPKYLDEEEMQKLIEKRQKEIADYKEFRESVERWREADRQNRNKTKIQQLEQCQALQAALDAARESINIPREAIRQRFLEAEQNRIDELANQEATMKADLEAKSPKGRKKSAGKKKK